MKKGNFEETHRGTAGNNRRGKFIVIEGPDASGKKTQLNLLQQKLKSFNENVLVADFPRYYDSPFGKLVGEFLAGKHGEFRKVSPYLALMPYMIDQYTWSRDTGEPFIEKGGVIIANRYFTSNVHQIAKLKGRERLEFREWLWPLGYETLGLLKPDLVLFLDVSPQIGKQLNSVKRKRAYLNGMREDEAEKDFRHQRESYKEYVITAEKEYYWTRIECTIEGKIKSPDKIHESIWREVGNLLNGRKNNADLGHAN